MYLMIDNYDSFVYNLACYLEECGEKVLLIRNDKITLAEIERLLADECLEGLIISPGPKSPKTVEIVKKFWKKTAGKSSCFRCLSGASDYRRSLAAHPCRKVQNPCTGKLQKYAIIRQDFLKVFPKFIL